MTTHHPQAATAVPPAPHAGLDTFVVVHDQELLLERERAGCFLGASNIQYLFVGKGPTDRIDHRSDVIVARLLSDNIEQHAKLLSFTGWYAVARNNLATTEHIAVLEYDVALDATYEESTLKVLRSGRNIVGYVPFQLTHPMYLHATPWFIQSLRDVYDVDVAELVRNHLANDGKDLWTCTTNVALTATDLSAFVDWFLPLSAIFRHDPIGAHVHERAISVYCWLNQIDNVWIPNKLTHTQARSHGFLAISQDAAKDRADASEPLTQSDMT